MEENEPIDDKDDEDYGEGSDAAQLIEKSKSSLRRYCSAESWKKRLPLLAWASTYKLEYLFYDVFASVVTSLTEIPQALAYAAIAGLPFEYGLYTGVLSSVIYGVLGSAKDVSIGPNVLVSLLVSSFGILHIKDFIRHDPKYIILLTFCSGIIQIILACTRLGAISSFISTSVLVGFGNAAALIISIRQLKFLLGLTFKSTSIFDEIRLVFANIGQTNYWDLIVGAVSLLILILLTKIATDVKQWQLKKDEVELSRWQRSCVWILWIISLSRIVLVVYTMTLITWILDLQGKSGFINIVGNVTSGINIQVPEIGNLHSYQAISVAIIVVPLMPFVLNYTVAKKYGRLNSYKVEDNQEFLALGFCNFLGSFVSAYPVTASSIRSSIMYHADVKTGLSSIITGGIMFISLLFMTPLMEFIPLASLAAVVFISLYPYIRIRVFKKMWDVNKLDLIPTLATFFCSLLVDVVYGIVIGIAVDLVILLLPIARPHFSMTITYSGGNQVTAANPFVTPAYVIQVESSVKYPAGDFLAEYLYDLTSSPDYVRPIILDFTHVSKLDITSVEYLGQALLDFHKVGGKLIFTKLQPLVYVQLTNANLEHMILAGTVEEAMDIVSEDVSSA
ncbi:sodium-independent sulfate anion transporter-like [Apostichopus japonicus]|uniref:sodium-independent sulfate anion transporter-like n=1 Tax=Stichopus japonicus TaxID=307972 RepID=UPI003AB69B38